jgi:hypothetical protein
VDKEVHYKYITIIRLKLTLFSSKGYKNEGVRRGVYKALKRPPVKGEKPMKTSRVEKSKEE